MLAHTFACIDCFYIEATQEIVKCSVLEHFIDIDFLECNCRLKLHVYVICHSIDPFVILFIVHIVDFTLAKSGLISLLLDIFNFSWLLDPSLFALLGRLVHG